MSQERNAQSKAWCPWQCKNVCKLSSEIFKFIFAFSTDHSWALAHSRQYSHLGVDQPPRNFVSGSLNNRDRAGYNGAVFDTSIKETEDRQIPVCERPTPSTCEFQDSQIQIETPSLQKQNLMSWQNFLTCELLQWSFMPSLTFPYHHYWLVQPHCISLHSTACLWASEDPL